jgi:hypothetical protein
MYPMMEIELSPDLECHLFLEPDYQLYDSSPGRQALTAEQKRLQRNRDKALFIDEYFAAYDWGPYKWSSPDFEVTELLWLLGLIDFAGDIRRPSNNAELEAALKNAVSEDLLIPEIHYCDRGGVAASIAAPESTSGVADGILTGSSSSNSIGWLDEAEAVGGVAGAGALGYGAYADTAAATDADTSSELDDPGTSTPLGDAQPFQYGQDSPLDDVQNIAARGVSEAEQQECNAMYEARMTYCSALSQMYGGDTRTYLACKDQAFQDYQACRGY